MGAPRILLTGGSGFVGIAILEQFVERHKDWPLTVADVVPLEAEFAKEHSIDYVKTDVKDKEQCLHAVQVAQPDIIIHAAGRVPGGLHRYGRQGKDDLFELNVGGTKNMLNVARACGVPNFIYTSSCTTHTDDLNHQYPNFTEDTPYPEKSLMYGESKVRASCLD